MDKYTVRFDPLTAQQLEKNAKEKHMNTASYIRHLVGIGLKVEEASARKAEEEAKENRLEKIHMRTCKHVVENLYLMRKIYSQMNPNNPTFSSDMKQISEKAKAFVEGLISEDI